MAEKIHVSEEELKKINPEKYEKKFSEEGFSWKGNESGSIGNWPRC